jgi:glutathione synthase/RimK-type ligase-like ATP-grasp enzyme
MEANIRCITQACQLNGFEHRFIDVNKNCVLVENELYFQLNRSPFNTESMAALCKDKEFQYNLLKDQINLPKTMGFLDISSMQKYHQYLNYDSIDGIISAIEDNFSYPVVIKQNKGALGINVFCCHDSSQVKEGIKQVFNKQSRDYDYVVLAQQFIKAKMEIRVIFFDGQPVLSYERIFAENSFGARYWETDEGKALPVESEELVQRCAREFAPAVTLKGLRFVALDIIIDEQDQLHLLELNSGPQVNHFIANNGEKPVVEMYARILGEWFE